MAISDGTAAWAHRWSGGTLSWKQLYNMSWGYTMTHKKVAAGTATAVMAGTAGAATAQNISSSTAITQPDVPRALSVTPSVNGTGSPLSVIVSGTNVEGKPITEAFIVPAGSTTIVNGVKAFKSVTNVAIPGNTSGLTVSVGTQNILGIRHRLYRNNTTVKVYSYSTVYGALTLQGTPTVVANDFDIELNTVSPLTAPNGSTALIIAYVYDNWSDGTSVNDQPEYVITTSTSSTSSSTSTTTLTTSTSTSSTSTSSTSSSVSSSSISTSSTSTSTTTAP